MNGFVETAGSSVTSIASHRSFAGHLCIHNEGARIGLLPALRDAIKRPSDLCVERVVFKGSDLIAANTISLSAVHHHQQPRCRVARIISLRCVDLVTIAKLDFTRRGFGICHGCRTEPCCQKCNVFHDPSLHRVLLSILTRDGFDFRNDKFVFRAEIILAAQSVRGNTGRLALAKRHHWQDTRCKRVTRCQPRPP